MIQDINTIIMTPLTIVVLLCVTTALLFICVYLCVAIKDLKEFIRDKMLACIESQKEVLNHCKKVAELDASLNKHCLNLIQEIRKYLDKKE